MSFSIIIPVYNTEKYLKRCFKSLIVEDCKYILKHHIKVLFVNDGSTDNSQKIIDQYEEKYDFVKSIYQKNQGLSVARNTAIKNITSDYFMLLDSDDWLDMEKLERVIVKLYKQKLNFISFGLSYYNENEEFTGFREEQTVTYNKEQKGIAFLKEGYQPSSACLFIYNKNFFLKNNLWFYSGIMQEDVEFTLRLMLKAQKGYFTIYYPYCYFRHSDSMTMTDDVARIKKYLEDSIIVAHQMSLNKSIKKYQDYNSIVEKNYNSVVWNLLWRFCSKPKEVDYDFKLQCIKDLKEKNLYPIKGPLKTKFQRLTRLFFNVEFLLKWMINR